MASSSETTGLLIVCHGSPLTAANEGFIEMVRRIAARLGMNHVLPAFFALVRPNLQDQIAELASRGVNRIVVLPYFLFQGQHVGVDIPNILAQCHEWFPQVTLELMPTLENDPAVETLVVQRLMSLGRESAGVSLKHVACTPAAARIALAAAANLRHNLPPSIAPGGAARVSNVMASSGEG